MFQPYEVYQLGVLFVACLLAQAVYAADVSGEALDEVLGPSVDLLVWILKQAGAEETSGMRPLQLPTCLRRLFGACITDILGPEVEPHLCVDQAAVAGGHCGPNIRAALAHLSGTRAPPSATSSTVVGNYGAGGTGRRRLPCHLG